LRLAVAACACLAIGVASSAIFYLVIRPASQTTALDQPAGAGHRTSRASAGPGPHLPRPIPVGALGTYRIARQRLVLTERSRANPGARVLRVTVRFPIVRNVAAYRSQSHGLFPLLVFAPGFRQCARSYSDLLAQWAGAGYVVAAIDFPRTSCSVPNPDEADLANQPADVAFVIRRLLELSGHPGSALSGLVAPSEIALAGHSDGGDTVAAMAAASCCRDRQVRAVVVLAGAEWPPLPGRWFTGPAPPMMFVQGSADTWNFPAASLQLYRADTTGKRYYLDLPGANHFAPYEGNGMPEPIVARVTTDFLDYYLLGERARLAAMWSASRVPGLAALVSAGHSPP
jgi:dienelactone hydrolase